MARNSIDVQDIKIAGLNASYTTITSDGISFTYQNDTFAHIIATTAATITIDTPITLDDGLTVEDRTIDLESSEEIFVGPFDKKIYGQDDNSIYIDSDQTDTDIAILRL